MAFAEILDEECPDVVHIHAFTRAVSILLVRAAKQRGIPVFFTYHTPTVSCQRGTLMLWGKEVCDGVLSVRRCTSCSVESRAIAHSASVLMGYVPPRFARGLEKANLSGGIWTALRMLELVQARHEAFQALMREVDGVVALREWVRALMVRNGVPRSKITLSQHGLWVIRDEWGRQQKFDISGGRIRWSIDEAPNHERPSTRKGVPSMDDYEILNRTNSTCECSVHYEPPRQGNLCGLFRHTGDVFLTVEGEPN
jgi:Glycosyl transferase 4-like domain